VSPPLQSVFGVACTRTALALVAVFLFHGCDSARKERIKVERVSLKACEAVVANGLRPIAQTRDQRFQGKVDEARALSRGGQIAVAARGTPWLDWANYFATGDASSKRSGLVTENGILAPNSRGINAALLDMEYQRIS
jgi:hypothetical protein